MSISGTWVVGAPVNGYKLRERDPGRHPLACTLNRELPISEGRIRDEGFA